MALLQACRRGERTLRRLFTRQPPMEWAPRIYMLHGTMHSQGRLTARPKADYEPGLFEHEGGSEFQSCGIDGLIFIPSILDRHKPFPLLVMLHGATQSATDAMAIVQSAAQDNGFMVVAPKSRDYTWDILRGGFGPDVEAIDEVLEKLFDEYPIDRSNVAIGGFSDGGSYAVTLGLQNGDLFRTVLAFSPGFSAAKLVIGRPRFYISHGHTDSILPFEKTGAPLARSLTEHGLEVRFDEFDGGHVVPFAKVNAATKWWLGP